MCNFFDKQILEFVTDPSALRELFTGSHTVPPPSAYVGAPNRTQGLVSSFFRPKTLCLICRYDDQVQDILVHKQPNLKFTSTTSLFLHLTTRL
jgi:hypothetical protein